MEGRPGCFVRLLFGVALVLLLVGVAQADELVKDDGTVFDGEFVTKDGVSVSFRVNGKVVRVPRAEVASVTTFVNFVALLGVADKSKLSELPKLRRVYEGHRVRVEGVLARAMSNEDGTCQARIDLMYNTRTKRTHPPDPSPPFDLMKEVFLDVRFKDEDYRAGMPDRMIGCSERIAFVARIELIEEKGRVRVWLKEPRTTKPAVSFDR